MDGTLIPAKAVTFRQGTENDKEGLQALRIVSWCEYERTLAPGHWQTLKSSIYNEENLEQLIFQSTVFVCLAGAEFVGMAFLIPSGHLSPVFSSEWAHIRMVSVHPRYRGVGIARMLTQMCIHHARDTNEKTIALHTSEFMDAARHLYESMGFKVLKEIDRIFGKRYWIYTVDL